MDVTVISVPYQLDVGRWCYALGPGAFLEAGLVGEIEAAGHTVAGVEEVELLRSERSRDSVANLGRIAAKTAALVARTAAAGGFSIVLECDCSHAVGVLGGLAQAGRRPGCAWFDAHGDIHTLQTTDSGYLGGMPLAVALGWEFDDWRVDAGLEPPLRSEDVVLCGVSDLDAAERAAAEAAGLAVIAAEELSSQAVDSTLGSLPSTADAWYLHVDVDIAGAEVVPGGMTPTANPPAAATIVEAVRAATAARPVRAAALATYNPSGDPSRHGARFGLEIAKTLLGA
jgi:arginase